MSDQPDWLKAHTPAPRTPLPHAFKPGVSGNPNGRPKKVYTNRELAAKTITDEIGAILLVMIQKAKEGDVPAASLLISRVLPTLRPRAETVKFSLDAKASLTQQAASVLQSMAAGVLDPDTSAQILTAIKALSDLKATDEIEARLAAIEARQGIQRTEAPGGVLAVESQGATLCLAR